MRALICLGLTLAVSLLHAEEIKSSDNVVVPGKRIGLITPGMSLADLVKAYGKKNVKDGELDGPEGSTMPGARLFAGTERELEVVWDENGKTVRLVRIMGSAWTFENGLKAGMSVEEVEKINGKPFKIFGWGWDYGGSAIIEEGELSGKVMLSFDPGSDEIPDGLVGEVELSSTDPKVRTLKPVVSSPITLFLGKAE
jgi:hypothetical protein